ncbi:UNVERIFIED_CONTAM: hypothetical protein FKN15_046590 [Acipenser sinensis]
MPDGGPEHISDLGNSFQGNTPNSLLGSTAASAAPTGPLKACGLRRIPSPNTNCNTGAIAPKTPGCLPPYKPVTRGTSSLSRDHGYIRERPSPGFRSQARSRYITLKQAINLVEHTSQQVGACGDSPAEASANVSPG